MLNALTNESNFNINKKLQTIFASALKLFYPKFCNQTEGHLG